MRFPCWSARLAVLLLATRCYAVIGVCAGPRHRVRHEPGDQLERTSVFAGMLRDRGHEVRTAIRLSDELADWAEGIVRFAPYPGPPEQGRGRLVPRLARRRPRPLARLRRARLRCRGRILEAGARRTLRSGPDGSPRSRRRKSGSKRPTGSIKSARKGQDGRRSQRLV